MIGGGAKAAALAAKASALKAADLADIRLTIFERKKIGANWGGAAGYTDGVQHLCTPIERDVGFPYASGEFFSPEIDAEMQREFAWTRYLVEDDGAYSDWVDSGRKPPTHEEFARYLKWVVDRAGAARTEIVEVSRLLPLPNRKWQVQKTLGKKFVDATKDATEFDAVVVSGPGPAKHLKGFKPIYFDGSDFWLRLKEVRKTLKNRDAEVVIVGGGGTAAAIVAWLVRNDNPERQITIIAGQASLFTRGDSVFENRLFTDDQLWKALSPDGRKEFFNRLNRGVVWATVMNEISKCQGLTFFPGRVEGLSIRAGRPNVKVMDGEKAMVDVGAELLIDASGFDPWWFLNLIPGASGLTKNMRAALERNISNSLQLTAKSWNWPRLHAPGLSSAHGPGLGNLMALGAMSDRVLSAYVKRKPGSA